MKRNLRVPAQYHIRKKVRGAKRRFRSLGGRIGTILESIADKSFARDKVLQYQLPDPSRLVDSTNSPRKLRKRFIQLLIDQLVELDGSIKGKGRALLIVSIPFLSKSRIDICLDSRHFQKLLDNTATPSSWVAAESGNIVKELNLSLASPYQVKGFVRNAKDRERNYIEENWIIWK